MTGSNIRSERLRRDLGIPGNVIRMTSGEFSLYIKQKITMAIKKIDMRELIQEAVQEELDRKRGRVR